MSMYFRPFFVMGGIVREREEDEKNEGFEELVGDVEPKVLLFVEDPGSEGAGFILRWEGIDCS